MNDVETNSAEIYSTGAYSVETNSAETYSVETNSTGAYSAETDSVNPDASTLCDNNNTRDNSNTTDTIVERIFSNHGNSLALCTCLSVCETRMPYREAEDRIAQRPELKMSTQNAHTLVGILLECGGIEAIEIPETTSVDDAELEDKPVDYLLETTQAGRSALAELEPTKRFFDLLTNEPANYTQLYKEVLALCVAGARKADIESHLAGNPALQSPKTIYPSYFISKLETVGGLVWDGTWQTTEAGQRMLAQLG